MSILRASNGGTSIVVCSTCKFKADEPLNASGERGGAALFRHVKDAMDALETASISVEPMACLFACSQHCTIHLRAPGKVGYVLANFEPTPESAQALAEFAQHYDQSLEGVVPYKNWPEGVKGHFLVRIPPEGMITVD
ncbi:MULTISPECIES: DUF1636 domain-containing protein [unclassified Brevundimonas]|uniref:DUF1636 domain-containing protein n=1 Tax=unclassified Brevundimonas TaxID=2622653 RepID=UPI0025C01099|nr:MULTISPECIES: DUF1636 domain-containing protein [unclassified Brevundimonas]